MLSLVIEEDVGAECPQECRLLHAAEEQRLVKADVPRAQGTYDPFVSGCAARRDECGADRAVLLKLLLQALQGPEKGLERTAFEGFLGGGFRGAEGLEPLLLKYPFRGVREQHRIAVEGQSEWAGRRPGDPSRCGKQRGGGNAVLQRVADIGGVGGEEQVAPECLDVPVRALAAAESGPGDIQFVGGDGIEYAQAGIGGVARKQDDFYPGFIQ